MPHHDHHARSRQGRLLGQQPMDTSDADVDERLDRLPQHLDRLDGLLGHGQIARAGDDDQDRRGVRRERRACRDRARDRVVPSLRDGRHDGARVVLDRARALIPQIG